MNQTVLHDVHVRLGAKLVEFAGWRMPLAYSQIRDEHRAVRTAAGLFDLSHMGRVRLGGAERVAFLETIATNSVADMERGEARYSLLCEEDGGIIDDVVYYHFADSILVVVNASNRDRDLAWMRQHQKDLRVTIDDRSEAVAMIALQGPKSEAILKRFTAAPLETVGYYHALQDAAVAGFPVTIARTGYTGEDGFELYVPSERAERLWSELLAVGEADGLVPCGLGARDTLRLEAAMPLYGHEIAKETDPLEAGLGTFVKWKKPDFVGKAALEARRERGGTGRKLVCATFDGKKIPREGMPVLAKGGGADPVGKVTSGTFSPTLDRPIAMAYVALAHAAVGTELEVDVRGDRLPGRVVKRPFYKREKQT